MKKLSLFFAAIALSMGTSFAQDVQPAKVTVAPGQSDVSLVFQTGAGHDAEVDQNGLFNNSFIWQETMGNAATVAQTNTVGSMIPTTSEIRQTGPANIAVVEQISTLDLSTINTEAFKIWLPLTAIINQSGQLNFAKQTQLKFMNTATINQMGTGNSAEQTQDLDMVDGYVGSFNTATITQSGSLNTADQAQNGWLNTAFIEQPGNGNTAIQDQVLYSMGNNAYALQTGNENISIQNQVGYLNKANVFQQSDKNQAVQDQSSGIVFTIESEDSNSLEDDLTLNSATIVQKGGPDNNAAQVQENGFFNTLNEADARQCGKGNTSTQGQFGGANYSSVQQNGCDNAATISQMFGMPAPF